MRMVLFEAGVCLIVLVHPACQCASQRAISCIRCVLHKYFVCVPGIFRGLQGDSMV